MLLFSFHHFLQSRTAEAHSSFNMPGRLQGSVALVSGSTQGFGRGIFATFAREGAAVLGMDIQATDGPVDGFAEEQAYQIQANVADEAGWKKAVSEANFQNLGVPLFSLFVIMFPLTSHFCSSSRHASHASERPPPSSSTTRAGRMQISQASRLRLKSSTAFLTSTSKASTSPPRSLFPK